MRSFELHFCFEGSPCFARFGFDWELYTHIHGQGWLVFVDSIVQFNGENPGNPSLRVGKRFGAQSIIETNLLFFSARCLHPNVLAAEVFHLGSGHGAC